MTKLVWRDVIISLGLYVFDSQTAHLYFAKIMEKSFLSCTKMRNNGSILVCNRVESIFGYLACHRKLYCYVKCMKNNQAWRNRKLIQSCR